MNDVDINPKKKYNLQKQFNEFEQLQSEPEKNSFLASNVLGLMVFTSIAYSDNSSFEEILECDVRGQVETRGETIQLSVGEIKSGKDRKKALVQCLKRLCIFGYASRTIFGDSRFLDLLGEIFTPLSWNPFTEKEIEEALEENRLRVPFNGRVHIKIIYLYVVRIIRADSFIALFVTIVGCVRVRSTITHDSWQ
eukprot:gene35827-48173_t